MEAYITYHIGIIILILIRNSSRPLYNLYHYSGVRLVVEKIFPPSNAVLNADEYVKPSSFVPWAVSIYVALFSIASARYDRAVNSYEMQIAAWQTQMTTEFRPQVCANLSNLQEIKVPKKPDILKPSSTIKSFYTNEKYEDGQATLLHTIEAYKQSLCYVSLNNSNLRGANLGGADLQGAALYHSDLREAILSGADLRGAALFASDFRGAYFENTDLRGADLSWANLRDAYFALADLRGADLEKVDFTKVKSLYKTKLPPKLEKELRKTHPRLFDDPSEEIMRSFLKN
ncbi:pentapeptide repeat-containing protein [Maridesulfovibrio sp.]|uniref:pentapeptide repeat-containing protein n=1 Tax=Maridesulfovibrio sp. TaxID=2795000 RepID=UPI002AA82953|nr:pentapeptide repeat-containing protein [Maridesulfovibrio sp.]